PQRGCRYGEAAASRKRGSRRCVETFAKIEKSSMRQTVVAVGVLMFGVGAVMAQQEIAVQQDNLMRGQVKSLYDVMLKMVQGKISYDQKAIDAAIADLEGSVPKIPTTFATN